MELWLSIHVPICIPKMVLNYIQIAKIQVMEMDFLKNVWKKEIRGTNVKVGSKSFVQNFGKEIFVFVFSGHGDKLWGIPMDNRIKV